MRPNDWRGVQLADLSVQNILSRRGKEVRCCGIDFAEIFTLDDPEDGSDVRDVAGVDTIP